LKDIGADQEGYYTMGPDGEPRYVRVCDRRRWSPSAGAYVPDRGEAEAQCEYNPFANERIWGR
jgi:hypothetical protein